MANNDDIDSQNSDAKITPILILLNEQNKEYKILSNENIYPNNFGDAFRKLVVKDHFFTVELSKKFLIIILQRSILHLDSMKRQKK